MTDEFLGYPCADGRVGVRDHCLILPLAASLVPLAADAATRVEGVWVGHEFESAATDAEYERVSRTFVGTASNPNVNTCIAIGDSSLEPRLLADLERMDAVSIVDADFVPSRRRIVERAVELARATYVPRTREPFPLARLVVGTECGGSDGWSGITANPALGVASDELVDRGATIVLAETPELIGAEHLLAERADADLADVVVGVVRRYEDTLAAIGEDIRGAQPTVGNMAGGLTTIEEKSLGAAKKAGTRRFGAVVEYAERVPESGAVVLMDTPGHDIEQMTGMIAGGCQVVVFTTGRGTPTGSAIAPVIKVATSTPVFERLRGDLDLDAGIVLKGRSLEDVGRQIVDAIVATASGERTSAEVRGANDFALSRFRPVAQDSGAARQPA